MAYDEALAGRLRAAMADQSHAAEKQMFGGLAFMVKGRMCVGIVGDDLMVPVGPERHDAALLEPHARPMDFTGQPMKGFIYVSPAGVRTAAALRKWVSWGVAYALVAPARKAAATNPKARSTSPSRRC